MSINKFFNQKYSGTTPEHTGDRFYSQDMVRDFWFQMDRAGMVLDDLMGQLPILISGGVVTQGAGLNLDITAGYGYAEYEVEIPDSFASTPPSKTTGDLEAIRISWGAQTNINASSANCSTYTVVDDGLTVQYVKMKFLETDGNTRSRAKSSGTYSYEITPDFDLVVDAVAPNDDEILLATFTSAAGVYTITASTTNALDYPTIKALSDLLNSRIGTIRTSANNSPESDELLCDGSAISRTTYAALYSKIGTTWGVGNGSTTFNIPDLRGAFLRGTGSHGSETKSDGNPFAGPSLGAFEDDAMQRIVGGLETVIANNGFADVSSVVSGVFNVDTGGTTYAGRTDTQSGNGRGIDFDSSASTSPNPARTDDTETKPFNAGVKFYIKVV